MMSLIPLPYRLLGALVIALGLVGSGYWAGSRNATNACIAGKSKAQVAAVTAAEKETTRREALGTQREVAHEQIRVVYRTIKEKADEYVKKMPEFNACGLDADGLRIWNAANSGAAAPLSGEPVSAVSDTGGSQVGQPDRPADQPHRGDGAVSGLPGQAGKAGGVR